MKRISLILIAALALMSCTTLKESNKTVTVSGEGVVRAKADVASFTIYASSVKDRAEDARGAVSVMINSALDALKAEFGVKDEDITTSYISINPYYEWTDGKRELKGQSASESVEVKLYDLDKAGLVFERLAALDGLSVSSITLDKSDKSDELRLARETAVRNAEEKARTYANALGYDIDSVISISDGTGALINSPRYDNAMLFEAKSSSSSTEYYADAITVQDSVAVTFSITSRR